ncbi:hypothetical protein [Thermosediminibacter litoriperuensis]|uniref:hypothetical protein n=1 Tax=Thermosediminibacter litoriperuensis TaxID=291989 RepID=UPI0011E7C638|nr:hypothetical protein [Thermosediminibacter litoriperuensis]
MNCPLCGGNSTGRVGTNQYYCWDCFVEFSINNNKVTVFELCDDGSLVPYGRKEAINGGNSS